MAVTVNNTITGGAAITTGDVTVGEVTIAASALPTGASTEATLATVHGHVDSLDGKVPALGQALAAASTPVVLPAAQDPVTVLGAVADASVATDTTGTVSGKLRGLVALMVSLVSHASRLLSSAFAAAGSGAAATTGFLFGGVYNATKPTITDTNQAPVGLTAKAALRVALEQSNGTAIDSIGGGTQYAEDAAHTSGDTGTMALAVRVDSAGALAGTTGDYSPLQVDANGALRVTGASGATEFAEDAAHTTGDKGVQSLAVRKDAGGTFAGTDGDYAPLQLDANGYLRVNVAAGISVTQYAEDAAHTTGDSGVQLLAVRQDSAAALAGTTGDYIPLSTSAGGALRVAPCKADGTIVEPVADAVDDAAFTPATSLISVIGAFADEAATDSVDEGDAGAVRMTLDRRLHVKTGAEFVDDAAFTPGTSAVLVMGAEADEGSTDSVDEGDAGALRMTLDRRLHVKTGGEFAEDAAHSSGDAGIQMLGVRKDSAGALAADGDYTPMTIWPDGGVKVGGCGLTPFRSIDLDESEEEVKATAGKLAYIWYSNLHATDARYLKVYNATAANVTVGTTTPVLTFRMRGATDATIAVPEGGWIFDTAITVAATTALADNDTGAPGAGEVVVNIGYK